MKKISYLPLFFAGVFCLLSFVLFYKLPQDNNHCDIDSAEYLAIAKEYQKTGNLISPDQPTHMPSHTIGYHWFLGIIFSVFNTSFQYIFLLQTLLCVLCCFLLYHLATTVFSASVGVITLLLFSCNIGFLVYCQIVLAEIVLVTFLIGFIYFFCLYIHCKQAINLLFGGLLLGCSVVIKPVALFYILPLTLLLFCSASKSLCQKIIICSLFMGAFYLPVMSYMCYNKKVFGVFCVTNLVSENIFVYFLPRRILPQVNNDYREKSFQALEACKTAEEKLRLSKKIFFEIACNYPLVICSAWLNAMLRTFCGLYSTQLKSMFNPTLQGGSCSFFNMNGTYLERIQKYICFGSTSPYLTAIAYVEAIWLILQYFLVILGFIYLLTIKEYFLFLFFSSYIGYFSFVTGHDGCARYRLMFEPILLLLAAVTLVKIYKLIKTTKNKQCNAVILRSTAT